MGLVQVKSVRCVVAAVDADRSAEDPEHTGLEPDRSFESRWYAKHHLQLSPRRCAHKSAENLSPDPDANIADDAEAQTARPLRPVSHECADANKYLIATRDDVEIYRLRNRNEG